MRKRQAQNRLTGLRGGDAALLSILAADFFGAIAGALVHLTMVWWVLEQGISGPTVSLLVLCIFMPLNFGVLLTGVAVDRFGSRRLLITSKLLASCGALVCFLLLAFNAMTLPILGLLAIVTYAGMAPSVAADIARVPAFTKLAGRRLESFHAANGIVMVVGQMLGLWGAGVLWDAIGPAPAVALGVALVLISTLITLFGFPRDRVRAPSPLSTVEQIKALSLSVWRHLDGPKMNLSYLLMTAAIIAASTACIEVAFPIAVAAAGLPASTLSMALILAVATGVSATFIAQWIYAQIKMGPALMTISICLLTLLVFSAARNDMVGFFVAVGATSAAAAAAGTFSITALQERMPVSLQAQAIGLWEFVTLSVGSVVILLTGFAGQYSLWFISGLALSGIVTSLWVDQKRRGSSLPHGRL